MSSEELESLCKSCGMCCDGTLFRRALLKPEELEPAKKNGLHVIQEKGFTQPCPQLKECGCAIYEERPSVCRVFKCKLLVRHEQEGGPLEPRLHIVNRVRFLLSELKRAGLERSEDGSGMTFSAEGADAAFAMTAFAELMERLEDDFARAVPPTSIETG